MSQQDDAHRYEQLTERELRDSIAKAEAQEDRVQAEGSPGAQEAQQERKEDLREELDERLEERRSGTPVEGRR